MKKILLFVTAIVFAMGLTACKDNTPDTLTYTVTFETDGGTAIASQEVTNGGKVELPENPTKDGYVFSGEWYNGNFEWNFAIDIVTEDITLVATWILVSTTPQNIAMTEVAFSSTVTWLQSDAELQTFEVSIKPVGGASFTVIDGTIDIVNGDVIDTVTFTPTTLPNGGLYIVQINTGVEMATSSELVFGGAGTEANPYILYQVADVLMLLEDATLSDKHFLQIDDILMTLDNPIEINNERQIVFSGVYDGGNHAISFGGNGGLFHEITTTGVVKNLTISSTTQLSASETNMYPIGAVANTNNGLIENVTTSAKLVNSRLQGELPVYDGTIDTTDHTTGAGGVVGINGETGIIRNVTVTGSGAVKAGRGVGGVSAYNFGLIEEAKVTATLPAGNQANSGKSSNTYSFGGGITGFNFGTISHCVVNGRVFAQSAYSASGDGNEGKNVAFGGIAGYNEGLITESSFARALTAKEFIDKLLADELGDASNNLGVASVHGDIYVGGIAGINAGDIEHSYVGGALIGGRDFVGGITGLTLNNGTITNSYVFAEVAIKDDAGIKITTPGAKTTLTVYEIAPSGFDNTVFYKALLNSGSGNVWVPGDAEAPMLPSFEAADLLVVGDKFSSVGLLKWQEGFVTGVDITLDTIVLSHGSTAELEYNVLPSTAPDSLTTWTTSDDSVVEIVGDGVIKGVGAGTATITVTTRDGGYTDTIIVTVEDYEKIDTVTVTVDFGVLPQPNNSEDRPEIIIGTVLTFTVDVLPETADYQNFTITTSNSRAVADGNTVSFVYGNTGPGNVSVFITFEDSSVAPLEYRFLTKEATQEIPIDTVTITSPEITLPLVNNAEDRPEIAIGTVITLDVAILPTTASNQNYTVTTSNSRAVADGNTITFVYGDTGPGNVSVIVTFEDSSIAPQEYRFVTYQTIPMTSYEISAVEITLPQVNNADDRPTIQIGTVITIVVNVLPIDATNGGYTITTSNSRAVVDGNTVTFVWGNTGPGRVSIYVNFDDPSVGELNYRFETIE